MLTPTPCQHLGQMPAQAILMTDNVDPNPLAPLLTRSSRGSEFGERAVTEERESDREGKGAAERQRDRELVCVCVCAFVCVRKL
jgi:hypothetical protein